jgi:hypothetical protein
MKNTFYRFMPFVFGTFLGWLLFHPPGWFQELGLMAWIVNAFLVAGLLLASVPLIMLANLPSDLKLVPLRQDEVPRELTQLREEFQRLGFRPVEPAWRAAIAPPAVLLGFVHDSEPVYGTLFRTTSVPAKTGYDLVSILEGERGGLTTGADPTGAALPAEAGGFRQVLPGKGLDELLAAHLDGLQYLRQQGLAPRAVTADLLQNDLVAAIRRQRDTVLASPLRGTLLTFWRAATRKVPFVGRLRDQTIAARQVQCLLNGRTQHTF